MTKNYAVLTARAEAAVGAISDPELKRIAFQKILDDLLAADESAGTKKRKSASKSQGTVGKKTRPTKGGPRAYLRELAEEGYFKKPKTITEVKGELANLGHHIPLTSLSGPLQALCKEKLLRRSKAKTPTGKKQAYAYSNW